MNSYTTINQMNIFDKTFALEEIFYKRAMTNSGIYPVKAMTGSGKTTAIGRLYSRNDYKKFTICISNNRKNISKMYEKHKLESGNPVAFEEESLLLFGGKDQLLDAYPKAQGMFYDRMVGKLDKSDLEFYIDKQRRIYKQMTGYKLGTDGIKKFMDTVNSWPEGIEFNMYSEFKSLIRNAIKQFHKKYTLKNLDSPISKKAAWEITVEELCTNDDKYEWLLIFFPQIRLNSKNRPYKRFYCNVSKFISPLDLMVDGKNIQKGYQHYFINSSVVFVDETDDCYRVIRDHLIEDASKNREFDLLKSFKSTRNQIKAKTLTTEEGLDSKNVINKLNVVKEWISIMEDKYGNFEYNAKNYNEKEEDEIVFFSGIDSVSITDSARICLGKDDSDNLKYVIYDNRDGFVEEEGHTQYDAYDPSCLEGEIKVGHDVNYPISELIEDIQEFENKLIDFLIAQIKYIKRRDAEEGVKTSESHVSSVVTNVAEFGSVYYNYLVEETLRRLNQKGISFNEGDPFAGFRYYYLEDTDMDSTNTRLKCARLDIVPEGIFYEISSKATLIPMSATIDITTRYSNFDIYSIQEKLARNNCERGYGLSLKESKEINKEYSLKTNNYSNIDLLSKVSTLDEANAFFDKLIEGDFIKVNDFSNLQKDNNEYYLDLFKKLVLSLKDYIELGGKAGVFLTTFDTTKSTAKVKDHEHIKKFFNAVVKYLGYDENEFALYFANSQNYGRIFDKELTPAFNSGKRVLLFTSYANLATGEDLSIRLTNSDIDKELIEPSKDMRFVNHSLVDFNFVYLSNITRLGVTKSYDGSPISKEDELRYLLENQRGYSQNKISNEDLDYRLKEFLLKKRIFGYNALEKAWEVQRIIFQSVGRISRNSNKFKNIIIMADDDIVKNFNKPMTSALLTKAIKDDGSLKEIKSLYSEFLKYVGYDNDKKDKYVEDNMIYAGEESSNYTKEFVNMFFEDRIKHRKEWEEVRKYLFPFYNYESEIPESLRNHLIQLDEPTDKILFKSYNDDLYEHFYKEVENSSKNDKYSIIGMKDNFLYYLLRNNDVKHILHQNGYEIPSLDKEYRFFPNGNFFKSITQGAWGEFLIKEFIEKIVNYKIKGLDDEFLELFDLQIKDTNIFIDCKNWMFMRVTSSELAKSTANKRKKLPDDYIAVYANLIDDSQYHIKNLAELRRVSEIEKGKVYDIGSLFYKEDSEGDLILNPRFFDNLETVVSLYRKKEGERDE